MREVIPFSVFGENFCIFQWSNCLFLNDKHMVLHTPLSCHLFLFGFSFNYWGFFLLYPLPSMCIHPVCQQASALRGLPTRYPCQPPPALPCYQPAAGVERPDWRAHSACPVIASVYHQPEDFYYCRWMIGLASCRPGKASSFLEQFEVRAPLYWGKQEGDDRSKKGDSVIWCRNKGAEMVVMTRHADARSIMHRGRGC